MGCACSNCRKGAGTRLSTAGPSVNIRKLVRKCQRYKAISDYLAKSLSEISIHKGDEFLAFPTAGKKIPEWLFGAVMKDAHVDIGFAPLNQLAQLGSLDAEDYFLNDISKTEAENMLSGSPNGTFLVRLDANGLPNIFVSFADRVRIFDIAVESIPLQSGGNTTAYRYYINKGAKNRFESIVELISHLKDNDVLCCRLVQSPQKPTPSLPDLPTEAKRRFRKIPREQIEVFGDIGGGNNAAVKKALWKRPGEDPIEVAVKQLNKDKSAEKQTLEFIREAAVMVGLHHPSLMQLYGVVIDGSTLLMVVEFIRGATLTKYLRRLHEEKRWLKEKQLVYILMQVARIMEYVHSKLISHKDLNSLNVMVELDENSDTIKSIKIIDFGLAELFNLDSPSTPEETQALKELGRLGAERSLSWNDVGAFGRFIHSVCTHGDLIEAGIDQEKFKDLVVGDYPKCDWSASGPDKLYKLATDCLQCDVNVRPSFQEIRSRLQNFYQEPEAAMSIPSKSSASAVVKTKVAAAATEDGAPRK